MSTPEGWQVKPLSEVVSIQRGFDLPHHARRPGPFPVLTSGETGGFHDEGPIKGPGVTIGRATNLGQPKWSEGDFWPHNTTMFVKDFRGNLPRWVFHYFENTDLAGFDSGSVQPMLNRNYIAQVPVLVPPVQEQQAISEVLGALDDKIAANTKLITKTDELSHTIFRSIQNADSQLVPLSDTAKFVNGKAFTKGASGTGRVVIRIAELNSGIGPSTVYNDIDVDDHHIARTGDLLFAWSGSLTLHRWFRSDGIVNQHIFKVIPNDSYPHWLVYELLRHKLEEFKAIAADKATTMGHIQRKHLDELVTVPATENIRRHNELMTGLWDQALAAEIESLKLTGVRDVLLPQLMSGMLRVKDVRKVLENAGV